jgi:hypothetical protein
MKKIKRELSLLISVDNQEKEEAISTTHPNTSIMIKVKQELMSIMC